MHILTHIMSWNRIIHRGAINNTLGPDGAKTAEVYVLSLPAFRWFKANGTSDSPRWGHTCLATNSNQMIMIGGNNPIYSKRLLGGDNGEPQDPWEQGIAVFDMTALQFKDSYDSKADPYEPPGVVQEFYRSQ